MKIDKCSLLEGGKLNTACFSRPLRCLVVSKLLTKEKEGEEISSVHAVRELSMRRDDLAEYLSCCLCSNNRRC